LEKVLVPPEIALRAELVVRMRFGLGVHG